MYNPETDLACFTPPFKITIDIRRLKSLTPHYWLIDTIALFFHELTHLYEYNFIFHRDSFSWNNMVNPEQRANHIQDCIYKLFGIKYIEE